MSVFEDQMLEAISPEFPNVEQEFANVKRALMEKPTIDAYGTKLHCEKLGNDYCAYGFIILRNDSCAELKKDEKIDILIKREWKETEEGTESVDKFTFEFYQDSVNVLEYKTTTELEPMPKAFNKVLSMIDIIRKGV